MASTSRKRSRPIDESDSESNISSDDELSLASHTDNEMFETDSETEEDPNYDLNPPVWAPNTRGMRPLQFTKEEEFLVPIPENAKPIDFYSMLVDDEFLETIVKYTNRNALQVFMTSPKLTPKSRIGQWKDLTVSELKIFFSLLLHTGTIKLPRLNDYWKTHWLYGTCFSNYMKRDRFLVILRCLCFSDIDNRDETNRLNKINYVIDYFNNKMSKIFYPQRELSIDESMILWRGRLKFRQYIKNKKHKYGIKIYTMSDPHGLILKFIVYCGALDDLGGKGHSANVVLKLMQEKLGCGHSLYMDNYYNSFVLASKLLANGTYCTGTLRMERKYLPLDVKTANLKTGETVARYSEGVLVGKWKDKRVVSYLSTEYENDMVESINARGQSRTKPLPIVKYNAFMKGVDRGDMMMAYYPIERKTLRWYKKLFTHTLHMLLINSYHLFNRNQTEKNERKMPFYEFRHSLLETMLPKPAEPTPHLPLRGTDHTLTKLGLRGDTNRSKNKNCRVCATQKIRKSTRFVCEACPGSPGLCPGTCFDIHHKK